jgi:hypothetical protein
VVLALQSCGGSSGGGSSSKTSSGFLSAAPIDNASCFIYKITTEGTKGDELTSSDSDKGIVTFSNVGYSGRALIQCSAGGTYTDEATDNEKNRRLYQSFIYTKILYYSDKKRLKQILH